MFFNLSIPFQSGTNKVLEAFTCQINNQTFIRYVQDIWILFALPLKAKLLKRYWQKYKIYHLSSYLQAGFSKKILKEMANAVLPWIQISSKSSQYKNNSLEGDHYSWRKLWTIYNFFLYKRLGSLNNNALCTSYLGKSCQNSIHLKHTYLLSLPCASYYDFMWVCKIGSIRGFSAMKHQEYLVDCGWGVAYIFAVFRMLNILVDSVIQPGFENHWITPMQNYWEGLCICKNYLQVTDTGRTALLIVTLGVNKSSLARKKKTAFSKNCREEKR